MGAPARALRRGDLELRRRLGLLLRLFTVPELLEGVLQRRAASVGVQLHERGHFGCVARRCASNANRAAFGSRKVNGVSRMNRVLYRARSRRRPGLESVTTRVQCAVRGLSRVIFGPISPMPYESGHYAYRREPSDVRKWRI